MSTEESATGDKLDSPANIGGGRKKKKTKVKTVALTEFLADGSTDTTFAAPKRTTSWADASEDIESDEAGVTWQEPSRVDRRALPTAPRASTQPRVELSKLPSKPPYTAYMGNLSFEVVESDVVDFFKRRNMKVTSVRLPRDASNRLKGFGYAEFEDMQSFLDALSLNDEQLRGRPVRLDVAEGDDKTDRRGSRSSEFDRGDWRRSQDQGLEYRKGDRDSDYRRYRSSEIRRDLDSEFKSDSVFRRDQDHDSDYRKEQDLELRRDNVMHFKDRDGEYRRGDRELENKRDRDLDYRKGDRDTEYIKDHELEYRDRDSEYRKGDHSSEYRRGYDSEYKKDHDSEYRRGDRDSEYRRGDRDSEYRRGDRDSEYRRGDRDSEYRRGDRSSEYRRDRNSEYRRRDRDSEYRRGDHDSEYRRGDRDSEYRRGDRDSEYRRGDRDSEYRRGDRDSEYRRGDYDSEYRRGDRDSEYRRGDRDSEYRRDYDSEYRRGDRSSEYRRDRDSGYRRGRGGRDSYRRVDGHEDSGPLGEPAKERPKLQLQPRTRPLTSDSDDTSRSSIFGQAKPVDTTAREKEIEERLLRQQHKQLEQSQASSHGDYQSYTSRSDKESYGKDKESHRDKESLTKKENKVPSGNAWLKGKPRILEKQDDTPVFSQPSKFAALLPEEDNSSQDE